MTPASCLTEFLTRKVFFKTEFLLPPSVGNQDNLLMGRTVWSRLSTGRKPRSLPWGSFLLGGRVALPQCSLVKTHHWIWSKGRLGFWTTGRVGGFTSVHEKIFQNRIVRQGRELGGGVSVKMSGGPCSAFGGGEERRSCENMKFYKSQFIMR